MANASLLYRRYRFVLGVFIAGLVVSGVTAFPLPREIDALLAARGYDVRAIDLSSPLDSSAKTLPVDNGFDRCLIEIRHGLRESHARYPWLAYGTDWLAFAHLVLAIFFIGPMIDPIRNVWVLQAGMIACVLVIPLALIAGEIRHIPWGWRLIDCSFGVFGAMPLAYCLRLTTKMKSG